jgi:hypothetical protein
MITPVSVLGDPGNPVIMDDGSSGGHDAARSPQMATPRFGISTMKSVGLTSRSGQSSCTYIMLISAVFAAIATRAEGQGGTWTQRMPANMPNASYAAMAYDSARSETVLFALGETWVWNGTNWTKRAPTNSPSNRQSHAMAFDSARGVTVLFGGSTGGPGSSNETWEWDGTNWALRNPMTKPSGRVDHAMAYDAARGVTMMFGGTVSGASNGETWEWNGTNWLQRQPMSAPSPRLGSMMVFDSARSVCLLFGGRAGADDNGTWEWNGMNWSQRMPATSPPARFAGGLAFDSVRGVAVLFGGYTGAFLGDTWEWSGVNWNEKVPAASPSARFRFGMAYDSARGVTVLFGGQTINGGSFSNETWEWACPDPQVISQEPADLSVAPGQAAVFSVAIQGPGLATYQWRKNQTALSDGGSIAGSSTATLTINPAAETDNGVYDCLINGPCAGLVTRAATLYVDPCKAADATGDCNGNDVLDSCEIAASSALDANADGTLDSCEPASQSSPCGMCGGGVATMMPLTILAIGTTISRTIRRRTLRARQLGDESR